LDLAKAEQQPKCGRRVLAGSLEVAACAKGQISFAALDVPAHVEPRLVSAGRAGGGPYVPFDDFGALP